MENGKCMYIYVWSYLMLKEYMSHNVSSWYSYISFLFLPLRDRAYYKLAITSWYLLQYIALTFSKMRIIPLKGIYYHLWYCYFKGIETLYYFGNWLKL